MCGVIIHERHCLWWFSERKTPVPIPNTDVKTHRGDNTWTVRFWEDSFLPRVLNMRHPGTEMVPGCLCCVVGGEGSLRKRGTFPLDNSIQAGDNNKTVNERADVQGVLGGSAWRVLWRETLQKRCLTGLLRLGYAKAPYK